MKVPRQVRNEIGVTVTGVVIAVLLVSGLVAVGFFVFMAIAMASYGSSK